MSDRRPRKTQYLAKRRRRVRELFFEGYEEVRVIARMLMDEGTMESVSFESAVRLVAADLHALKAALAKTRETGEPDALARSETEALERLLAGLRDDLAYQLCVADGEPDEKGDPAVTSTSVDAPGGLFVSTRPKWPPGIRQKARRDAQRLREKIADVEARVVAIRDQIAGIGDGVGTGGGLTIVEDGRPIAQQIEANNFRVN